MDGLLVYNLLYPFRTMYGVWVCTVKIFNSWECTFTLRGISIFCDSGLSGEGLSSQVFIFCYLCEHWKLRGGFLPQQNIHMRKYGCPHVQV